MGNIDLHMHTVASDGEHTNFEVINKLVEKGVKYFAITDHDTKKGSQEFLTDQKLIKIIKENNMRFYTGIEFSCTLLGKKAHVIGYGMDLSNKNIDDINKANEKRRREKLKVKLDYLQIKNEIIIPQSEVNEMLKKPTVGTVDIAKAIVKYGYSKSVSAAMEQYIDGVEFPSVKTKIPCEDAARAIHEAGGKVVWAHPLGGVGDKRKTPAEIEEKLNVFCQFGLDGIEAYYALYNKEEIDGLLKLAKKHNLYVSCGSDFHGLNIKKEDILTLSCDGTMPKSSEITILSVIKPAVM